MEVILKTEVPKLGGRGDEIASALDQRVVLVTHDLELVAGYDRVLVFDEARLVHDGPPAESVAAYRALMASGLR